MARRFLSAAVIAGALAIAAPTFAQKPANAPKNATAQCSDGTFSTAKTERGACSRHGGVKTWWGTATSPKATSAPKSATPSAAPPTPPPTSESTRAATMPQDATGQCVDGTYTKAKTQRGACSNHGGVKTWFAESTPGVPPPVPPAAPSAPKPSSGSTPKAATQPSTKAPPAGAPEGATAKCRDGSYSFAKTHRGACSRHGGVAEWYK